MCIHSKLRKKTCLVSLRFIVLIRDVYSKKSKTYKLFITSCTPIQNLIFINQIPL